jgi:hypothetical protein
MKRNTRIAMMVVAGLGLVVMAGCGSQAQMSLNFKAGDTGTYKVTTETVKDFKFEQPSMEPPKIKEDQTKTMAVVTFEQKIDAVDAKSGAIATITLKAIEYIVTDKNSVKFDFNSAREEDMKKPFAQLIGKSYKITLAPNGKVSVLDAAEARKISDAGYDGKLAQALLADERIVERHQIPAMPDGAAATVTAGKGWSKVVPSPAGLLAPKNYQKVYTLEKVEGGKDNPVAFVKMVGKVSSEPVKEGSVKGMDSMGPFAKMFDTQEAYDGQLVLETGTGKVRKCQEKLVVTYLASEAPADQKPDKGPDTLTMRFTYNFDLTKVQ